MHGRAVFWICGRGGKGAGGGEEPGKNYFDRGGKGRGRSVGDGGKDYFDWGDGSIYLSVDCFGSLLLEATRRARRMLLCHVLSCFALFDRLGKGRGRERGLWREMS